MNKHSTSFPDGEHDPPAQETASDLTISIPLKKWREYAIIGIINDVLYIADDLMVLPKSFLDKACLFDDGILTHADLPLHIPKRVREELVKVYCQKAVRLHNEDFNKPPMLRVRCANITNSSLGWMSFLEIPFEAYPICEYQFKKAHGEDSIDPAKQHNLASTGVYTFSIDQKHLFVLAYGQGGFDDLPESLHLFQVDIATRALKHYACKELDYFKLKLCTHCYGTYLDPLSETHLVVKQGMLANRLIDEKKEYEDKNADFHDYHLFIDGENMTFTIEQRTYIVPRPAFFTDWTYILFWQASRDDLKRFVTVSGNSKESKVGLWVLDSSYAPLKPERKWVGNQNVDLQPSELCGQIHHVQSCGKKSYIIAAKKNKDLNEFCGNMASRYGRSIRAAYDGFSYEHDDGMAYCVYELSLDESRGTYRTELSFSMPFEMTAKQRWIDPYFNGEQLVSINEEVVQVFRVRDPEVAKTLFKIFGLSTEQVAIIENRLAQQEADKKNDTSKTVGRPEGIPAATMNIFEPREGDFAPSATSATGVDPSAATTDHSMVPECASTITHFVTNQSASSDNASTAHVTAVNSPEATPTPSNPASPVSPAQPKEHFPLTSLVPVKSPQDDSDGSDGSYAPESSTISTKCYVCAHSIDDGLETRECGYIFKNMDDIEPHLRSVHDFTPYECKFGDCTAVFKTPMELLIHAETEKHEMTKHRCVIQGCGKYFPDGYSCERHVIKHLDGTSDEPPHYENSWSSKDDTGTSPDVPYYKRYPDYNVNETTSCYKVVPGKLYNGYYKRLNEGRRDIRAVVRQEELAPRRDLRVSDEWGYQRQDDGQPSGNDRQDSSIQSIASHFSMEHMPVQPQSTLETNDNLVKPKKLYLPRFVPIRRHHMKSLPNLPKEKKLSKKERRRLKKEEVSQATSETFDDPMDKIIHLEKKFDLVCKKTSEMSLDANFDPRPVEIPLNDNKDIDEYATCEEADDSDREDPLYSSELNATRSWNVWFRVVSSAEKCPSDHQAPQQQPEAAQPSNQPGLSRSETYPCRIDYCDSFFTSLDAYLAHIRSAHQLQAPVNPFQCQFCKQTFTNGLALLSHEESTGHTADGVRCIIPECDRVFKATNLLEIHVNVDHFRDEASSFASRDIPMVGIAGHHCHHAENDPIGVIQQEPELIRCPWKKCKGVFEGSHLLAIHEKKSGHRFNGVQCTQGCWKFFKSHKGLAWHLWEYHDAVEKPKGAFVKDEETTDEEEADVHGTVEDTLKTGDDQETSQEPSSTSAIGVDHSRAVSKRFVAGAHNWEDQEDVTKRFTALQEVDGRQNTTNDDQESPKEVLTEANMPEEEYTDNTDDEFYHTSVQETKKAFKKVECDSTKPCGGCQIAMKTMESTKSVNINPPGGASSHGNPSVSVSKTSGDVPSDGRPLVNPLKTLKNAGDVRRLRQIVRATQELKRAKKPGHGSPSKASPTKKSYGKKALPRPKSPQTADDVLRLFQELGITKKKGAQGKAFKCCFQGCGAKFDRVDVFELHKKIWEH